LQADLRQFSKKLSSGRRNQLYISGVNGRLIWEWVVEGEYLAPWHLPSPDWKDQTAWNSLTPSLAAYAKSAEIEMNSDPTSDPGPVYSATTIL
jgi:hypothetical protein